MTLAYLNQKPVRAAELYPALVELAGGAVLAEYVLDQGLQERLSQRGQRIEPQAIQEERLILMQTLHSDPNQAQRLVDELRQRRGLGTVRWEQLLWRNAAMRQLVQDQVTVTDAAIAQEYEMVHGPRWEARLVTTENLAQAAQVVQRAREGESFTELAIRMSTDVSRSQGGLLPPISAQDSSFPSAVRTTLAGMKEGQVSDPVTLDRGFAVLKLERIIQGDQARLDDVKSSLALRVRRQIERLAMQRLVREMMEKVDLVVTDPTLNKAWAQQKKQMFEP